MQKKNYVFFSRGGSHSAGQIVSWDVMARMVDTNFLQHVPHRSNDWQKSLAQVTTTANSSQMPDVLLKRFHSWKQPPGSSGKTLLQAALLYCIRLRHGLLVPIQKYSLVSREKSRTPVCVLEMGWCSLTALTPYRMSRTLDRRFQTEIDCPPVPSGILERTLPRLHLLQAKCWVVNNRKSRAIGWRKAGQHQEAGSVAVNWSQWLAPLDLQFFFFGGRLLSVSMALYWDHVLSQRWKERDCLEARKMEGEAQSWKATLSMAWHLKWTLFSVSEPFNGMQN